MTTNYYWEVLRLFWDENMSQQQTMLLSVFVLGQLVPKIINSHCEILKPQSSEDQKLQRSMPFWSLHLKGKKRKMLLRCSIKQFDLRGTLQEKLKRKNWRFLPLGNLNIHSKCHGYPAIIFQAIQSQCKVLVKGTFRPVVASLRKIIRS